MWFLGGESALIGGLTTVVAAALTMLLVSIPLWVLMQAILALFKVGREDRALGYWDGHSFVYHEPMHVKTISVSPEDCHEWKEFDIPKDVELGVLATFTTKIDGAKDRIKVTFHPEYAEAQMVWGTAGSQSGIRFPKNRKASIKVQMLSGTVRSRIRIYLLKWEV